jgi:hypothetical protein
MPPPDPRQSLFSALPDGVTACDTPASAAAAATAADSSLHRLQESAEFDEHELAEMEEQLGVAEQALDHLVGQAAAADVVLGQIDREYGEAVAALDAHARGVTPLSEMDEGFHEARRDGYRAARRTPAREADNAGAAVRRQQAWLDEQQAHWDRRRSQARVRHQRLASIQPRLDEAAERERDALIRSFDPTGIYTAPTGRTTHMPPARYFRVLAWNLENFTRDPRPRGSAPIDSLRNQTRIAIVANLFQRLGTDVLLAMETGLDVGTAMTQLATRIRSHEMPPTDLRTCEPLTSPATHPIPRVRLDYPNLQLGRHSVARVLALRTLASSFSISPHPSARDLPVTARQIQDAYMLLAAVSGGVRELDDPPFIEGTGWQDRGCITVENGNFAPGPAWFMTCWGELTKHELHVSDVFMLQPLIDWLQMGARLPIDPLVSRHLLEDLRGMADHARRNDLPTLRGAMELAELGLLLLFKAAGMMQLDASDEHVWAGQSLAENLIPRVVLYYTACQRVCLRAHDRDLGPLASTNDQELILGALRRIGAETYAHETYGMVYRPGSPELLAQFFTGPCGQLGFDANGVYGILQQGTNDVLRLQRPGDVLGGRSAMFCAFPATAHRWIPLALHHNRFTGNQAIQNMDDHVSLDNPFTGGENVLRARTLSVVEVCAALAAQSGPVRPLLIGDFNLPASLLEVEAEPMNETARQAQARQRRGWMRDELQDGVLTSGYLRRSVAGAHPRTSLVSNASLAGAGEVGSQPYDAVYQPFDFMEGAANVASGVVTGMAALIPPELLAQPVSGTAPRTDSDAALDDAEDEGGAGEGQDDASDGPQPTQPRQDSTVQAVLAQEIRRTYRSLIRQAIAAIKTAQDWIRLEILARTAVDLDVTDLFALNDADGVLPALVANCSDELHRLMGIDFNVVVHQAGYPRHPLEDWIERATRVLAAPRKRPPRQLAELPQVLVRIRDQLLVAETQPERRLWMAYRAIVSDHLPLIIEIDLEQPS